VKSTGDIYVGGYGEIVRIHPDGTLERVFERANTDFDGLALSPDELTLWLNHDDGGVVGHLHLDANGDVVSFNTVVDLNGSLDGASVDTCGNYYVVTIAGVLWRVRPDGDSQRMADLSRAGASYTTAARFGSGLGGWARDHLYVMDRTTGTLMDVALDVEGTPMPHWP
jgi:sugar lactone lactonase YvrE